MNLCFNADILAKSVGCKNENGILFEEYFEIRKADDSNPNDPKFEYFKKKILDHLAELEKKENGYIAKSIDLTEWIQKANFPVGTIRTWNGQKFKKITPKKWVRVYESESRGAKLSVAALRRKAAACKNSEELYQLCLENMERFRDKEGQPLPFMQEFSEYVSGLNGRNEPPNDGYLEKNYPGYKGKGQEAVDFIAKNKGGQVMGAFNRPEIGDIDVVWGKVTNAEKHEGYGLAHIIDMHGIEAVKKIGDIIKDGQLVTDESNNRISIEYDGYHLGLRQQWNGKKKIWIVTNFKKGGTTENSYSNSDYTGETLPVTSNTNISQNGEKSNEKKRGALRVLTKQETHDFIEKHKTSEINEKVSLGNVSDETKKRIQDATGIEVERVILDSDSVRHAYDKPAHNLEPNDLDNMKEIIETTTDISLSPEKTKQGTPVIIFKKQEPNGVILCEEYRAGKKELELQTAYRVKKNRQPHSAENQPLANVRNVTAPISNIQQNGEKSSSKKGNVLAENKQPKPSGKGDFGDIYDCFKGKPKEAIDFLLKNKNGEAIGALKHKDIGDIDLVWGEEGTSHSDGYGLAKLAKYHHEVLDNLQEILDDMNVVEKTKNRVQLESKTHKASVRLTWNGKSKKWLLTTFEKNSGVSDSSTDIAKTDGSHKNDTAPLVNTANLNIQQNGEKSIGKKGIESIREKYQSSKYIEGDEDEIYVGKETISGKWKLVEADAPSASHDEVTFHKTEGFPTAKDGSTVNDRDYEHDAAAQETVLDIAADFDGRALGFDSPVVVTQDGVVASGNNRTMSSKLAARKGTDTKYIEALKKRAKKFGFSADDVAQFNHPRVVFETEHKGDYTTNEFAKYNESGKKAMNPVEKAVKVSKLIQPQTVEDIAGTISEFNTMGELYANKKASQSIFNTLIQSNIIQKTDLPQYYSDNSVTAAGKEFLETVLIGSVINETNIRALNGAKSLRQKLVRAITPLIENKGMKGYSINKELNEAVGIAIEIAHNKDKFPDVEAFSKQQDMFRKLDPVSIELAKKLEGTQKGFAEFMLEMNGGLRPAANGEVDIFFGGVESKEDIVNRVLHIKETVKKALDRFFRIFGATA